MAGTTDRAHWGATPMNLILCKHTINIIWRFHLIAFVACDVYHIVLWRYDMNEKFDLNLYSLMGMGSLFNFVEWFVCLLSNLNILEFYCEQNVQHFDNETMYVYGQNTSVKNQVSIRAMVFQAQFSEIYGGK